MTLALEKCDLKFRYDQRTTMALESHDCPKLNMTFLDHKTEIGQKKNDISRGVDRALIEEDSNYKTQTGTKNFISVSNIINAVEIPICFQKTLLMYKHGSFSILF